MSNKKKTAKKQRISEVKLTIEDDGPFSKLLPSEIDQAWSQEMKDSELFADDNDLKAAKKYWLQYVSENIQNFKNKDDFADFVVSDANEKAAAYLSFGWECLIKATTPSTLISSENLHPKVLGSLSDACVSKYSNLTVINSPDDLTKEVREHFPRKVNFLVDFVASSNFRFVLFQKLFQNTNVPTEVSLHSSHALIFPTKYLPPPQKKKRKDSVPLLDMHSAYILPLQLSTDVNDDFWKEIEQFISAESESKKSLTNASLENGQIQ